MGLIQFIRENQIKREILSNWSLMLNGLNISDKNQMTYEILDIFIKEYGFDCIVSIPPGLNYLKFRDFINNIENMYQAEVVAELSSNRNSIYVKVHILDLDISEKDSIRFKWCKILSKNECRNSSGETFMVNHMEELYKPNTECIIGYNLSIKIPYEKSFSDLLKYEEAIESSIGKCIFKNKITEGECKLILSPLEDNTKFEVIKCEPYELYCGMTHSYEPIMLNFKSNANLIVGGKNGTGKTVAVIAALTNLAMQYTSKEIQFFIGMTSNKQDLRIFRDLEMTQYYANDIESLYSMLSYLNKECKRRNDKFNNYKKMVFNIHEYNKYQKESDKIPIIYFISDEIADFMSDKKSDGLIYKCNELFWKLAREGRNTGIYMTVATQRGDRENMKANVKAQMGNKLCFYQPNLTSAQTIFGDKTECCQKITRLERSREFLVDYEEGTDMAKTLYLTNTMMEKMLKSKFVENKQFLKLDNNGNIIKEVEVQVEEKIKKEVNNARFMKYKNTQKQVVFDN